MTLAKRNSHPSGSGLEASFEVAAPAALQVAGLTDAEKSELIRSLVDGEGVVTTPKGHFVSRIGAKRVLWARTENGKPVVLSILDSSYGVRDESVR